VSGVSGAAPVWRVVMQQLHEAAPSKRAAPPFGVVRYRARFEADLEPPRDELALAGTEPVSSRRTPLAAGAFGIRSPRSGSIFALDPDMPPQVQKIVFEGESGTWLLDGKVVGRGSRISWAPWPGRHELALRAGHGSVLHTVRFEVRGVSLKTATLRP
jgi:penicillin-binding protein 1C